jgi:hypothetical protein
MSKKRKRWVLRFWHKTEGKMKRAKMWGSRMSQKFHTERAANDALVAWEKGGGNIGAWIYTKEDGWEAEVIYK